MGAILIALAAAQVALHNDIRLINEGAAKGTAITSRDLAAISTRLESLCTQIGLALVDLDARVTALE